MPQALDRILVASDRHRKGEYTDEPATGLTEANVSLVEDSLGVRAPDHVHLSAGGTSAE